MTVAYVDHNNEWILAIIGRISSRGLVFYAFVGPMKRKVAVFYYYPKYNRCSTHLRHNV